MTRPRRCHLQDEEGFTLIEMMVSLTMFAVLSTALAGVFYASLRTATASTQRSKASALATRETEALKAIPYDTLGFYSVQSGYLASFEGRTTVTLGGAIPADANVQTEPRGTATVGPTVFSVVRNVVWADTAGPSGSYAQAYKRTTVQITWTDGVGPHTVRQDSIVYPGGRGAYVGPGGGSTTSTTSTPASSILTPPPGAPTLDSAAPAADPAGRSQIDVAWTAPSPAAGGSVNYYVVEQATNSGFTSNVVASPQQPASASSYPVTGLAPNTTYWFRVVAFGSTGASSTPSNSRSATTLPQPVATCTFFSISVTGSGGKSYASSKTYHGNQSKMSENLNFSVSASASCAGTVSVQAIGPGGTPDPGSPPYLLTSTGGSSYTGTVYSSGQTGWSVGVHTFSVLHNGSPISPTVAKTFLVCAKSNRPSADPTRC